MENKNKIKDAEGMHRENASGRSEAEIRYSAVFEQSPDGILIIDTDGKIIDFNEAAHADLGYTREEFAKLSISDIDPLESPEEIRAHIQKTINKKKAEFEVTHRSKTGAFRNVLVIAQTIVLSGRTVLHAIWRDITDQKAMDKKVRYLASILEHVPDAVCSIDTEGRIVSWNEGAELILGYKAGEIIGRPISSIIPEEKAREEVEHCIGALNKEGVFTGHETVRVAKDGRRVPLEISGLALREGRKITGYASIMRDLTERKLAEESLKKSLSLLKATLDSTADGILVVNENGRISGFNEQFAKLWGIPKTILDLHDDQKALDFVLVQLKDQERFISKVRELYADPETTSFDVLEFKDGRVFERYSQPQRIDGKPVGRVWSFRDVTDRMNVEKALKNSEGRLNTILENVGAAIFIKDSQYRYTYVNRKVCEFFGRRTEEILGKSDSEFFSVGSVEEIMRSDRPVIERGETVTREETELTSFDKVPRTYWTVKLPLRDSTGTITGLCGISTDITDRKEAEEKLRQSEAFIRNILDTVDEGFIVIDRDFRILTANKAYCSQVGKTCDSVIGRHCYEISHKTLRPCHEEGEECAVLHVFETGEPHTALHKHPDAKGSILYVETKAFPIKDSTGAVTSVIETVNNITEKHLLEEEQLKTQKLEAIGTLAGGIAHDFNNLLQGVFGYISMAKLTLDQKEHSLAMLEQAEKALHMSVNLTTQLLTFSKGGKPAKKKIQLKSVIENSVRFALSGSSVDFKIKFDDNLWTVDADDGQIGQVIQNIVLNADQAMPTGGKIVIAAKNVCAPGEGLPSHLAKGKYVEISVKDNGIGIPEQYIPRLFDPYFTTKEKGSGLGLATSYSIIKNHGGLIDAKSRLGSGSIFSVYLPAVGEDDERAGIIPAAAEIVRKGRVLLMDDEEVVRTIVGIMIGSLGHELEFAENGEEAVAKYREALLSGRRFDIAILDLTVRGGMGGEEAIRELLALDPEVKAVVSSGYADSATISEYESRGFSACLTKPYEVDALRDILNLLLK